MHTEVPDGEEREGIKNGSEETMIKKLKSIKQRNRYPYRGPTG